MLPYFLRHMLPLSDLPLLSTPPHNLSFSQPSPGHRIDSHPSLPIRGPPWKDSCCVTGQYMSSVKEDGYCLTPCLQSCNKPPTLLIQTSIKFPSEFLGLSLADLYLIHLLTELALYFKHKTKLAEKRHDLGIFPCLVLPPNVHNLHCYIILHS